VRILVHDFSGHPFQIQLSRALAARGDDVLHAYCGDILTPKGPLARRPDDPVGFRVRDLGRGREFPKYQLGRRVIDESRYARRFAASAREFRPDVVLLSNDPPVARLLAVRACRRAGIPVVLWLQDLYALGLSLLFRQRLGPLASAPTLVANSLERRALRGCAAIVVIGKEFVEPVRRMVQAPTPVQARFRPEPAGHRRNLAASSQPSSASPDTRDILAIPCSNYSNAVADDAAAPSSVKAAARSMEAADRSAASSWAESCRWLEPLRFAAL